MAEAVTPVEIPNRALFKAAEVCDLVKVQPYVLRTWEAEFPELGVAKTEGGPRVYRRTDVEQVLKIKHLLLVEGLTLAGARRKLQEPVGPMPAAGDAAQAADILIDGPARERLTQVKRGLQGILELLTQRAPVTDFQLTSPPPEVDVRAAEPAASEHKVKARSTTGGGATRRKR